MIHLFTDFAQVFLGKSRNFKIFFYSLFHKDLSAFRGIPKIVFFVKSAQVGPIIEERCSSNWALAPRFLAKTSAGLSIK